MVHAKYFIGDSVCELFRSTPNLWSDDSDYFLKMTILNMYPQAWQLITGKENIHKPESSLPADFGEFLGHINRTQVFTVYTSWAL